uniref:hypothetical protein n=1 Tax=Fluviicola sp. TaxID=1917219 RepID=UPI002622B8AC
MDCGNDHFAHLLNLLILGPFSVGGEFSFGEILNFLFVLTAFWFYWDDEILRDERIYLKCAAL